MKKIVILTAEAKLKQKVIKGGGGLWGQIPMPANAVTEKEAETLVKLFLESNNAVKTALTKAVTPTPVKNY